MAKQELVKLLHPEGGGNFTHDGVEYEMDEDGFLFVPDSIVSVAQAHGYRTLSDIENRLAGTQVKAPTAAEMKRSQLIVYIAKHNLDPGASASLDDMREIVQKDLDRRAASAEQRKTDDEAAAGEDSKPTTGRLRRHG